jgi:hypothetical protein
VSHHGLAGKAIQSTYPQFLTKGNSMTDPRKAGALILNNIGMFNDAAMLMSETIEVELFKKIDEEIEQWQKENEWHGEGNWYGDCMWVCPPAWGVDIEDDSWKAYFEFDRKKGDLADKVELASFCGCGRTRVGFRFTATSEYFGNKKQWLNFCNKSLPAAASELQKLGFTYDKGFWFLPITLSSTDLAMAYEGDDYAAALQPIRLALDQLKAAQPIFDEIIKSAESVLDIKAPALI